MPQLDTSTFISQIFWLIICFVVLWMIIGCFVTPKIGDIVQRRQHKIDDYLSAAEKFKQSAEELVARYDAAIVKAEQTAENTWENAKEELKIATEKLQEDMSIKLKEKTQATEDELRKIEVEVKNQVDAMSVSLAEKVAINLGLSFVKKEDILSAAKKGGNDE